MQVRLATPDDLPAYFALAQEFVNALPVADIVGSDPRGLVDFLGTALDRDDVAMWLAERDGEIIGICGALAYPLFFNPGRIAVQELWWWLTPKARGGPAAKMLFDAMEEWAKVQNAAALMMVALNNDSGERVSRFYEKSGFQLMESVFIRKVPQWQ